MIKCEVIREFTLEEFDKLKNIQRKKLDTKGKLYVGDVFECTKEMASYLMGNNKNGDVVVKVVEIIPKEEPVKAKIEFFEEENKPKAILKKAKKKK